GGICMKMEDVFKLMNGLQALINKELPIGTAYKIQSNFKKVADEVQVADNLRQKLIKKYDVEVLENKIKVKSGKEKEFNKEINELFKQESDIELKHIKMNDLEGINIKPSTIMLLQPILKDDDE